MSLGVLSHCATALMSSLLFSPELSSNFGETQCRLQILNLKTNPNHHIVNNANRIFALVVIGILAHLPRWVVRQYFVDTAFSCHQCLASGKAKNSARLIDNAVTLKNAFTAIAYRHWHFSACRVTRRVVAVGAGLLFAPYPVAPMR